MATKKRGAVHKVKSVYKKCVRKLRGTVRFSEVHKVCGRLATKRRRTRKKTTRPKAAKRRHHSYYAVYFEHVGHVNKRTGKEAGRAKSFEGPFPSRALAEASMRHDMARYETPRSHYKIQTRKPW
jgi:hypothetical protein